MDVLFCGTSDHPPYLDLIEAHDIDTMNCSMRSPTKKLSCIESLQIILDQTVRDTCIGILQLQVFVRHILPLREEKIKRPSFDLDGML